jgi:class 3 adenylate cyclase
MAEERRVVTILFADVAGSTALGDALDAEDARMLLRRYYDIARETLAEHGGILEKFIGDAVVAVFGFPQTHDDDPQRALAAALTLRDRVRADPSLGERLPIRFGINTGEVVAARESATGDFPLTGDAVNVAARLQSMTEPWGILCGERTVVSAGGAFEFGSPIIAELRGKPQPLRALPLLGRREHRLLARRAALVGRSADLQQLELAAQRSFQEQRPFLVSIIAPAGVGKSRLLEEFLERLPAIEPNATVAIAQCLPYGQRLTYWPLRGVLYRLIGVADDSKPHAVRQAIRTWLDGSGPEAVDRTVDLLAATVGSGESDAVDSAALLAAWRTAFEIAARRAPLVLAFEDLHWSSDSLLDLFEFVMQPRSELPLLMIALSRPELLDRRPAWGGGRRNYVSIALEPLSDQNTRQLVEQLLGIASPDLVDRVVRHAEGNPFFAAELVQSALERPGIDQLPDTVQAAVLARLDLLLPEERRLVQLGSIFGRTFRLDGIHLLEPELQSLADVAERLVEKDLVRAAGPESFTFRHILIREVAYQTLTRAERGRLHAAAAAWLESQALERQDALAELIAYHYREAALIMTAQRPGQTETERIRSKAVDWLSLAAEAAKSAAASLEGSRHLRSAIDLANPLRLPDLYQRLGEMTDAGDRVVEAYREALRLSREQGRSPKQELQILAGLLTSYMRFQGSVSNRPTEDELSVLRRDARELAAVVTDPRTLGAYFAAEGFFPFWLRGGTRLATPEEVESAALAARKALDLARQLDDPSLQSVVLDAMSGTAQDFDDWRRSREYARQRVALADRLAVEERVDAYSMVAWASALLGDLDDAERVSALGLAQVQPGQVPGQALHLAAWRIYVLTLQGRWDEALTVAERTRQLWLEVSRAPTGYAAFGFMAAMDIARARQDEALIELYGGITDEILAAFPVGTASRRWLGYGALDLTLVEASVHRFHEVPEVQMQRYERGLSLLLDRDLPPPVETVLPMLELSRKRDFLLVEAQTERAIARTRRDLQGFGRAISLFEGAGALPYASRARCERALLTGDEDEMEAGLGVLERIGDTEQVGRFERLRVG